MMKNILITGGSGMVGKNLLEHPSSKNYIIHSPSSSILNLFDYSVVYDYIKSNDVDIIIHCAGQVGGIHANMSDPTGFLNNNLLMGINLVNAAKANNVAQLINLGSSCMYPRDYINPLKEEYILNAPLEPTNEGYALAKITVAKLCEYIRRQYGLEYKTLIPCNLYGRWDKFAESNSHLIPAVIKKINDAHINNQSTVEIWGDGLARREFMLASDCADGIFYALDNFARLDDYTNLGLGYDYSINDYYQAVADVIGYNGKFVHDLSKPVGMQQKLVDTSKIKSLGWSAKHTLCDGLEETYKFFTDMQK